jgi:hypothetical protein
MMDILGIEASQTQHIVGPHLGVEVRVSDVSHLRKLVEMYVDRKALTEVA